MRRFVFACLMLFVAGFSQAQNEEVDSLKLELKKAKHDTIRVEIIEIIGETIFPQNPDSALSYFRLAKKMAEEKLPAFSNTSKEHLFFKKAIATCLHNMALGHQQEGRISEALSDFNKSLKIREEIGDKFETANTLSAIGTIYDDQGNIPEALVYYNKSLKLNEEIGDKKGIASCLNNLGYVYDNQGDTKKSLEYYTKSLKIKEEINDKQSIASSLNNIGVVYYNLDNMISSLAYANRCLKMCEETGNKKGIAYSYNTIGAIYNSQGDGTKALEYYFNSLKTHEEVNNKIGIATSLNNIGRVYDELGDITKALQYHNKALKIREEIGNKSGIAISLHNIGSIYENQDSTKKALEYFERSLKMREEIENKEGIAYTLNTIGCIYLKEKKYQSALLCFHKSLTTAKEINFPKLVKPVVQNLYKTYLYQLSPDSAFKYVSEMKNNISERVKRNYFSLSETEREKYFATMESDLGLYYDFASKYYEKFPFITDTSYNMALTNKGLNLKSSTAMRTAILNSNDSSLINNYENWMALKKKISKLYESGKKIEELENQANNLEKDLVLRSNIFSDLEKIKNTDWKLVQKGLKKNEAAIEFVRFKSQIDTAHPVNYVALIIKPGIAHPIMVTLCSENDLKKIINEFQGNNSSFVNKVYGSKNETQTGLYEKIWKPMDTYLKGVKNIYYSPDGLLHKISFSAISTEKNVYLCDKYNLNRQSSTGKVAFTDVIKYSAADKVMLVGGVKYNSNTTDKEIWSYLPGTLSEVEQIKAQLDKQNVSTDYFVASSASEENVKKSIAGENILHVATHGFFFPDPEKVKEEQKLKINVEKNLAFRGTSDYANWSFVSNKNPLMRSGFVLAGANDVWKREPLTEGEDGVLTAQEVSNLDMQKTKLVVLSACETGLGDIKGSEGVYGLQRAFKMAGVKNIIMSLWQVPDKETSEFMIGFYKKLSVDGDIKKAFISTQKEMRKKYDPYYWAAFVLVE